MASPEGLRAPSEQNRSPRESFRLPPELAAFLREHTYACVTETTNIGTAMIMKLPGTDIESIRGPVLIQLRHELFNHPASPVIRMVFTIFDRLDAPLALETFVNVANPAQQLEYERLNHQPELPLLFFDETVQHRLSKRITLPHEGEIGMVSATAQALLAKIPQTVQDFDAAKCAVLQHYPL
jgi:hypothetical protein